MSNSRLAAAAARAEALETRAELAALKRTVREAQEAINWARTNDPKAIRKEAREVRDQARSLRKTVASDQSASLGDLKLADLDAQVNR